MSQKVHFMEFKIRSNVSTAASGHVAEDRTADLSTQLGLCCLQRHALPNKEGHVSEDSTGRAALRGLLCCVERSAVLSSATWPGAAMKTLYLILNIIKCTF